MSGEVTKYKIFKKLNVIDAMGLILALREESNLQILLNLLFSAPTEQIYSFYKEFDIEEKDTTETRELLKKEVSDIGGNSVKIACIFRSLPDGKSLSSKEKAIYAKKKKQRIAKSTSYSNSKIKKLNKQINKHEDKKDRLKETTGDVKINFAEIEKKKKEELTNQKLRYISPYSSKTGKQINEEFNKIYYSLISHDMEENEKEEIFIELVKNWGYMHFKVMESTESIRKEIENCQKTFFIYNLMKEFYFSNAFDESGQSFSIEDRRRVQYYCRRCNSSMYEFINRDWGRTARGAIGIFFHVIDMTDKHNYLYVCPECGFWILNPNF